MMNDNRARLASMCCDNAVRAIRSTPLSTSHVAQCRECQYMSGFLIRTPPPLTPVSVCQGSPIRAPPSHLFVCVSVAPFRTPITHPLQPPHNPKLRMIVWICRKQTEP
jgi:hypothetical protein